jgi:hypothetical protein
VPDRRAPSKHLVAGSSPAGRTQPCDLRLLVRAARQSHCTALDRRRAGGRYGDCGRRPDVAGGLATPRVDDDFPVLSDDVIVLRCLGREDAAQHLAGEDDDQIRWLSGGPASMERLPYWIDSNRRTVENGWPASPLRRSGCSYQRPRGQRRGEFTIRGLGARRGQHFLSRVPDLARTRHRTPSRVVGLRLAADGPLLRKGGYSRRTGQCSFSQSAEGRRLHPDRVADSADGSPLVRYEKALQ